LSINGIGPETADSILLYAFNKPVFVVDAYTKRIFYRHSVVNDDSYEAVQKLFMDNLDAGVQLFNEYHALIVQAGKDFCRPNPLCSQCPLNDVSYSLKYKCMKCHKAIMTGSERRLVKDGNSNKEYLCRFCHIHSGKKE